jgi:hypothetical protein
MANSNPGKLIMKGKNSFLISGILLMLALMALFIPLASGDNEPNDSLIQAESLGEGTFTGSVSLGVFDDDVDYYVISVPAKKDLVVKVEVTELGDLGITITSYDYKREDLGIFGIWMYLDAEGEVESDSWYNSDDQARDLYLGIEGDGDYKITIEFTSDTEEAVETLAGICFLGTFGMICGIIIFILVVIGIIVLIIWLVNRNKKKTNPPKPQKQQPPRQQVPPQEPPR